MNEPTKRQNKRRSVEGIIVSDKMQKTRVVQVQMATKHDKYHKVIKSAAKFKVHDEKNESKKGDLVSIMETRPLSKDKRWILRRIIRTS